MNKDIHYYNTRSNANLHPPNTNFTKIKKGAYYVGIGLYLRVLKLSTPYISSPLNYICNKIIHSGTFPERLKYSVIKPLYKKGDK